uniref:Uncharacterized protein n=1 Tax=Pararge aegeria TaxID=116150 RepID=S4PVE4_9NEOP
MTDFGHGGQSPERFSNYAGYIIVHKSKYTFHFFIFIVCDGTAAPTRPERDPVHDRPLSVLSVAGDVSPPISKLWHGETAGTI